MACNTTITAALHNEEAFHTDTRTNVFVLPKQLVIHLSNDSFEDFSWAWGWEVSWTVEE